MHRNSQTGMPSPRGNRVFRNSSSARYQKKGRQTGAYIDPAKFINKAVAVADEVVYVPTHTFADFDFHPQLQANLADRGYVTPTAIQDQAMKPVLAGGDLVGLANTGTGKTAAFSLPIIQHLLNNGRQGQALIMVPTRELAVQIEEEFRSFARGLNLYAALCVGGASMSRQLAQLSRRPQVVIGTPGRLKDLAGQGALKLGQTTILVLDEADRMVDMGFIKDIRFIIDQLPSARQSLCFSATMTPDIKVLCESFLRDPVTVSVRTSETSDHVEQDIVRAQSKDHKHEVLTQMLREPEFEKVLIFGQTKWGVQRLADNLVKDGLQAVAIHGNKSQPQRQKALQAFKNNQVKIMVATDVAARGIDIPNVSHVINFDQPNTYDDYVHRIGRTGRAGKRGKALTFVVPSHP